MAFLYGDLDKIDCRADPNSNEPLESPDQEGLNVTKEFKSAIIWGFWLSVSALVRAILAQIALYYKLFILLWISYFMFAINIALVVMLFTFMNVWRWAHEGRVCSGDYLDGGKKGADESVYLIGEGRFLKVILCMVYFVILLAFLAICTAVCVFNRSAERRAEEENGTNKKKRVTAMTMAIDYDYETAVRRGSQVGKTFHQKQVQKQNVNFGSDNEEMDDSKDNTGDVSSDAEA